MMPSAVIYARVLTALARYVVPILTAILLYRCIRPLIFSRQEPEIWGWLYTSDGKKHPITHWETVIGSGKGCDLHLTSPGVEKRHALITRYGDGSWSILSIRHAPVRVGGCDAEAFVLQTEESVKLGEETVRFVAATERQAAHFAYLRANMISGAYDVRSLLLLTALQVILSACYAWGQSPDVTAAVIFGFGGLAFAGWLLMMLCSVWGRAAFEAEILALYLCTLGMCVIASVCPEEAYKQLFAVLLGVALYAVLGRMLRDPERAKKFRYAFAIAGLLLLWVTFLFGKVFNGAKSWLIFENFSVQPSELAKISLIFAGCTAMDRQKNKWELLAFCLYGILCCLCLGLSNDFGTALVFFLVFAVLALCRQIDRGFFKICSRCIWPCISV